MKNNLQLNIFLCRGNTLDNPISDRAAQWCSFAQDVINHVQDYTVEQYGDYPDDPVSDYTEQDILMQINRYINRIKTNIRGPEEAQRDLYKIVHYICLLDARRKNPEGKI